MNQTGTLDRLIGRCRDTGVLRRANGRWVAGVCVGLGARWNVDPVLVRVGFILLSLFGGVGVTVYLVCWLLLPGPDGDVALERALRGGDGAAIALLVIAVISVASAFTPHAGEPRGSAFGLIVVALVVWWLFRNGKLSMPAPASTSTPAGTATTPGTSTPAGTSTPTGTSTPGRTPAAQGSPVGSSHAPMSTDSPYPAPLTVPPALADIPPYSPHRDTRTAPPHTIATVPPAAHRDRGTGWLLTLVGAGLAILAYLAVDALGDQLALRESWLLPLSAALIVIGGTLVVAAVRGYRAPLLGISAVIIGISLISSLGPQRHHLPGPAVIRPTSAAEVQSSYRHGVGDMTLDLTAVPVDGTRSVSLDHGVGELTVILPTGTSAAVTVDGGVGDTTVEENGDTRSLSGWDNREGSTYTVGTGPQAYRLSLDHGVGDVVIRFAEPATPPATTPSTEPSRQPSAPSSPSNSADTRALAAGGQQS